MTTAATPITETVRINNDQTIKTSVGEFMVVQRNAGYADNDGHWTVTQLAELYWSPIGVLRQRRPGLFLGVFDTPAAAMASIEDAVPQPIDDKMAGF
jgi:hypothetical protein